MRLVSFLVAISLWTGSALAQISASLSRIVNLPVVGLASSETAQVNVVNLAASFSAVLGAAPPVSTTASCTGSITFYNASGNIINPNSTASFTIGTGQIYSASLPYSDIAVGDRPSGNGRTTIWAAVTINGSNNSSTPCTLASNIETFDTSTGVTHIHVESSTVAASALLPLR
jgi:hypothetical protein